MSEFDSPIKAKQMVLGELFTRFMFVIPKFQRPFSWSAEHFEKLFTDIYDAMSYGQEAYFIGSMVFWLDRQQGENIYQVIDGQQRLASLTILIAMLRDRISKEDDKRKLHILVYEEGNEYLGVPSKERLSVWEELQEYFKNYIYTIGGTIRFLNDLKNKRIRIDRESMYHLKEVIETFSRLIDESMRNEEELKNFAKYLIQRVYVVSIRTDSLGSAIRLFNVLNTRGLPLSPSDIIKAINLEAIKDESERERYADKWIEIENDLGREELENLLSLIRFIYAKDKARKSLSEEYEQLYKRIISRGKEFINLLDEYRAIYKRNIIHSDEGWTSTSNMLDTRLGRYIILIDMLKQYYPVKEWIAPLLYFYKRFPDDKSYLEFFERLEKKLIIDWLAELSSTEIITRLSWILRLIEEASEPSEVLAKMYSYIPPGTRVRGRIINYNNRDEVDKIIEQALNRRDFARWKAGKPAKYLLLRIDFEHQLSEEQVPRYNLGSITLEHILPRNPPPDSDWVKKFDELARYEWTDRLGNLVLISGKKNTKASNYDFNRKKKEYLGEKGKTLAITLDVLKYDDWTVETLKERHTRLIQEIKKIYNTLIL